MKKFHIIIVALTETDRWIKEIDAVDVVNNEQGAMNSEPKYRLTDFPF